MNIRWSQSPFMNTYNDVAKPQYDEKGLHIHDTTQTLSPVIIAAKSLQSISTKERLWSLRPKLFHNFAPQENLCSDKKEP